MKNTLYTLVLILLCIGETVAQKEANIWYFGYNAGLDFNSGVPIALTDGSLNTFRGSSSISDKNGSLLFYSDGMTVFNATHDTMPNGSGIIGQPVTQAALIVEMPGSDSLYYLFTLEGINGFRYSIVDMSLDGGLGDIVPSSKNTLLYAPSTSKLTAVHHKNGCDVWVITHEWSSNAFYTYLLSDTGLSLPVISNTGTVHASLGNFQGQMKTSSDGRKIALAVGGSLPNFVELFDFNNQTGYLSNSLTLLTVSGLPTQPWGISFSPDNSKLYAANSQSSQAIVQFDLSAGDSSAIIASMDTIGFPNYSLGSLQLAPDNKIYVARNSSGYIGVINNPNKPGDACNYVDSALFLAGRTSGLGLPGFVESYFARPDFTVANDTVCLVNSNAFNASSPYIASWNWNFDDTASANNTDTAQNPSHLFSDTGVYNVQLIITGACKTDTVIKTIVVKPNTLGVNLGIDTTTCYGVSITLNATNPGNVYLWSTGDTTQTITTDTPGTYYVLVSQKGCYVSDTITISEVPEIIINLGNDTVNCGQDSILLDAGTTGNIFIWSTGDTTQTITVNSTNTYSVSVFNSGCFNSDTISIVQSQVSALILNIDTTLNLGSSVQLSGTVTGGSNYSWSPATGLSCTSCLNPSASPEDTTTYTLTVTDTNDCEASDEITITIDASGVIFIPDIFSPNNDGNNDILYVRGKGIESIKLSVYDRWGEMVFETTDITVGWDGMYKGKKMNPAVFVYYVTGSFTNGRELNETGNFALVR